MSFPCPSCGLSGPAFERDMCGRCGTPFATFYAHAIPRQSSKPHVENLWALPLAFLVALEVCSTTTGKFILSSTVSMWMHELGHAVWFWLNGRPAIPLLFFTPAACQRSVLFSGVLLAWLLLGLRSARQQSTRAGTALLAASLVLFCGCALFVGPETERFFAAFAGVFGSFWISTLCVVLFYYAFPLALQWSRLRWLALYFGALVFVHTTAIFLAARHDYSLLPWGAFWGGDGDLDFLRDHGWPAAKIERVYLGVAGLGIATMAAHYLYFARAAVAELRSDRSA